MMPWIRELNVAMYEGADWSGYIRTEENCSPEQARRIGFSDPTVDFFFFCRESFQLSNPAWAGNKHFEAGDAVFFSGKPWPGDAPQSDIYRKDGIAVAYVDQPTPSVLMDASSYITGAGMASVDVVCIFAANIGQSPGPGDVRLAPHVQVPAGGSLAIGNPHVVDSLESSAIRSLQAKGVTVLLSFLNYHDGAGWSQFASAADADQFALQLEYLVDKYALDGIDIDDEYSAGTALADSVVMAALAIRRAMPDKIISKALYNDIQNFDVTYQGVRLAKLLTYGWEMSYGGDAQRRLPKYVDAGMSRHALALGFSAAHPAPDPAADVKWLKSNGYAGVMDYPFNQGDDQALVGSLVDAWCGPGYWIRTPDPS